jgi:hypothetical protein
MDIWRSSELYVYQNFINNSRIDLKIFNIDLF